MRTDIHCKGQAAGEQRSAWFISFQHFRMRVGSKPKNTMSNATCASPIASSQLFFAWSDHAEAPQPTAIAPAVDTIDTPRPDISALSDRLSFTPRSARIGKPVRMGAVMIKLLKRYGITDQEIAEGVANYARKHQKALAG